MSLVIYFSFASVTVAQKFQDQSLSSFIIETDDIIDEQHYYYQTLDEGTVNSPNINHALCLTTLL